MVVISSPTLSPLSPATFPPAETKLKIKGLRKDLKRKVKHAADVAADDLAKLMGGRDGENASPISLPTSKAMSELESHRQAKTSTAAEPTSRPNMKKLKRRPPRIRKNAVVRGIKITDAESKKRVLDILAAEKAEKANAMDVSDMDSDDEPA